MLVCTNTNMVICLLIAHAQSWKYEMQVSAAGSLFFVHIIKCCYVTWFKFQADTFSIYFDIKKKAKFLNSPKLLHN